jgi:tyrosinase
MFVNLVQVLALVATVQGAVAKPRNAIDDLQNQAIATLKGVKTHGPQKCTLSKAAVRKDWATMSGKERKAYTTAVQCMLDSPSKSDPALVPGARNRYDDFVGQHINQTLTIHGTGNFLTWVSNLTCS